ncbi:hypothetical protein LJK88_20505 [Paenibacillus sp. P26]|nr:hypothetical protein LJK88_38230 [Paenibacillus sp. P26]UUZ85670.1 hypothetical protein LJK88_20505 [Paenibacillus sp. P26]UUZ93251.1 hypothetical protein LJK87_00060 [Paenibacillus sp. P25]UUZ95984.1 hypothetical protein LJK87_17365 [Paenibacillus sp. P25]
MPIDPVLDLTADNIKDYVYVKTNVGGWFFDAWISMEHSSKLTITDHPVQTGAAISDHAFLQPRSLSMEIGMSDVATSFIPGQFDGDWSRSVAAYKVILELQRLRIPVQILTRLGLLENMLIESITAPDDYTTLNGLKVQVTFRQIMVATVKTVKVSSRPVQDNQASRGRQEPQSLTEDQRSSLLYKMTGEVTTGLRINSGGR